MIAVILLLVLEVGISIAAPTGECAIGVRNDCGRQADLVNYPQARCINDTRCCWDTSAIPYCYYKATQQQPQICLFDPSLRVDCGYGKNAPGNPKWGISPNECIAKGCCFMNVLKGISCYYTPVPGGWTSWSSSECSVTCGTNGFMSSKRTCTNPAPAYNGPTCVGDSTANLPCDPMPTKCPIAGGWTTWTPYSECSVTCSDGTNQGKQTRKRTCTNPAPQFGGDNCNGDASDVRDCAPSVARCAIDGKWSSWASWGDCSVTCGKDGIMTRARTCSNPAPQFGGRFCAESSSDQMSCTPEPKPCAIDGGWTEFTAWSTCSVSCGDGGQVTRTRECTNPAPQYGGAKCVDSNSQTADCTPKPGGCPRDGGWTDWSDWTPCSVTCGDGGKSTRARTCTNPIPLNGGKFCSGDASETQDCQPDIADCKHPDGWGDFTEWGKCSLSCVGTDGVVGKMTRTRKCNTPPKGQTTCSGDSSETMDCAPIPDRCPIDGDWTEWSSYSKCSVTCGPGGQKVRTRVCSNPSPQFNGKTCDGDATDSVACDDSPNCPVDGAWTVWASWGSCSVTCGDNGFQSRSRTCTDPAPAYGGANCVDSSSEKMSCSPKPNPCPIDGGWTEYTKWSDCSVTCGEGGIVTRSRTCTNPDPQYGGKMCEGSDAQTDDCSPRPAGCPRDGGWTEWESWSSCSVTCGEGGRTTRARTCTNPSPLNGGVYCTGDASDTKDCQPDVFDCKHPDGWGDFTEWGKCSISCVGEDGKVGTMTRTRTCDHPPKGQDNCDGDSSETVDCTPVPDRCPIDGGWTEWSPYSQCSVSCGPGGQKVRERQCNNPRPQFKGKSCEGDASDSAACDDSPDCPVDGKWTSWKSWGSCSVRCGNDGIQTRTRECTEPAPAYGGRKCTENFSENQACNPKPKPCAIDGDWTPFSPWSTCSVTCGEGGKVTRTRSCSSPAPQYDGEDCAGENSETADCTPIPRGCPIDGGWTDWTDWTACSVTCGKGGRRSRGRECTNPAPLNDGNYCQGEASDTEDCQPDVVDCKHPDGWGDFTEWGKCSISCVGEDGKVGKMTRTRTCNNPPKGKTTCDGDSSETVDCQPIPDRCPIDGGWTNWSAYSKCSVTCGPDGDMVRYRECSDPPPQFNGLPCGGEASQMAACDDSPNCPVDCQCSYWAEWSKCSVSCGEGGVKRRARECTSPQYGGEECPKETAQEAECDTFVGCPEPGSWSPFAPITPCSVTCGSDGYQVVQRTCTNPGPLNGGDDCPGDATDKAPCEPTPPTCRIDGQWSKWSSYSECSKTCGHGGLMSRSRTCTEPPPSNGGDPCVGNDAETTYCVPENPKCDGTCTCTIKGDPYVQTFDGTKLQISGQGDFSVWTSNTGSAAVSIGNDHVHPGISVVTTLKLNFAKGGTVTLTAKGITGGEGDAFTTDKDGRTFTVTHKDSGVVGKFYSDALTTTATLVIDKADDNANTFGYCAQCDGVAGNDYIGKDGKNYAGNANFAEKLSNDFRAS